MDAPLIDSHCHLDDKAYDEDRQAVIETARKSGLVGFINPGSDLENSKKAVRLAHEQTVVFAAVGIHPHITKTGQTNFDKEFVELAELAKDPEVVGVGEFGLDLKDNSETLEVQIDLVLKHLELARANELPVILHCRDLYKELAQIIKEHGEGLQGVAHSFAGSPEEAQLFLDLGFYIGFSGMLTFEKGTQNIREACKRTPLERLLIETDAPYLSPEPRRGKRNTPSEVATIGRFIAELRGIPYSELAQATTANARKLFALPDVIETHQEG